MGWKGREVNLNLSELHALIPVVVTLLHHFDRIPLMRRILPQSQPMECVDAHVRELTTRVVGGHATYGRSLAGG
jgi:hypothetical protein